MVFSKPYRKASNEVITTSKLRIYVAIMGPNALQLMRLIFDNRHKEAAFVAKLHCGLKKTEVEK